MSIQLDTSRLASASQTQVQDSYTPAASGKAAAALFGGASVTVTAGGTGDLEALVAKLKNESERAKFTMLLTSLATIGQSLTDAQKRVLEQGLALSEKLDALEKSVKDLLGEASTIKADAALLEAKIDNLQKLIDQAIEDGKEHNELVAEQKRLRKELAEKEQTLEKTQGEIDKAKNDISSVKGQISAIVKSIGENTVKTIASDLSTLSDAEKAERPAEAAKEEEKKDAVDIFASIRKSLSEIERDITETIEENRIETV